MYMKYLLYVLMVVEMSVYLTQKRKRKLPGYYYSNVSWIFNPHISIDLNK